MATTRAGWNFAVVWEVIADHLSDAPALVHGAVRRSWRDFDRRADGVAARLLDGAHEQDKVAQYLYNCPEYVESVFACFKAGLVPVNTNYRYGADELVYLWQNADVTTVVFHGSFAERIAELRDRVPLVRTWLWVDDGRGDCPPWAEPYEAAASSSTARVVPPWGRRPDHLYLLYTGGTTGLPKGVMWRQDDLYRVFSETTMHDPDELDLDAVRSRISGPGPVTLPACPLMHGTGAFSAFQALCLGAAVVTLTSRKLDVAELLDTVARERVKGLVIVGDAVARPILDALHAEPGRWDVSSLRVITSSGAMWSEHSKRALLDLQPRLLLVDSFGSSEAMGIGRSVSSADGTRATASFSVGVRTRVVDDDGNDVVPGSGVIGRIAVKGPCPVGYYKDPERSARTFVVLGGETYAIPGDYATVDPDGGLVLLGRGSACINTGGEKVFPEEVEEVLKEDPSVRDAAVVGVPDERFGEVVVALVEPPAGVDPDEAALVAFVKSRLASYKAPKRVFAVESVRRAANGKLDHVGLKQEAVERMAAAVRPAAG